MINETPERAAVYYGTKRAGVLTKILGGHDRAKYEFVYDPDYLSDVGAMPISLSMPLRQEKYESDRLFPFFEGLLPEGWLLDLICSSAKIDKEDGFRLLLHVGQDPIGAVSVHPLEENHG